MVAAGSSLENFMTNILQKDRLPFSRVWEKVELENYRAAAEMLSVVDSPALSPIGPHRPHGVSAPLTPELFARESARISGFGEDHMAIHIVEEEEKYYSGGQVRTVIRRRREFANERFKAHVELAKTCLNWKNHDRPVHPLIINTSLCEPSLASRSPLRGGMPHGMWGILPQAADIPALLEQWMGYVESARALSVPPNDRAIFSWLLHDWLICLQPFQMLNDRTARLMLQVIRRRFGLEPLLVRYDNMIFHEKRLAHMRHRIFIPLLRDAGFLSRAPT